MSFSRLVAASLFALGVCPFVVTPAQAQHGRAPWADWRLHLPATSQARDPERASDEVMVQFRAGVGSAARQLVADHLGARIKQVLLAETGRADRKGDLQLFTLPGGLDVAQALVMLAREADVEFAEPNWLYHGDVAGVDEVYRRGDQWNIYGRATSLFTNPYGTGAEHAWANGNRCNGAVFVGIVDWGVMSEHPDLRRNMWINRFDPVDGIDNDNNGYTDDVQGWDFVHADNNTFDGVEDGHGTHVAGIIGAQGGNEIGVVGMCPRVKMINAKFIGPDGRGKASDAILAIDYITDMKTRHHLNLVAINNSWGGFGFSQAMQDAITRAGTADILFVAVAGNTYSNNDETPYYPSGYDNDNIIAVAAIDKRGNKGDFSNYGAISVDLGAPGVGVWSTVPLAAEDGGYGYEPHTGTSMATPHVTGAVALYASSHPGLTGKQIKAAILANTIPTPSLKDKTVTGGRLDVSRF